MKATPLFAKGVSRHTCRKAARIYARRMARNRVAPDHHLIYAFRETLTEMRPAETILGTLSPEVAQ